MVANQDPEVELRAARSSREYHDRHRPTLNLIGKRRALSAFAEKTYLERLSLNPTAGERATLDALANPDTLLLEVAHDGQLPHLGIVRLVLKTHDIARLDQQAATLYLIGNHYSPEMRPDNLHFGMPLRGNPPNRVKHPPRLRIGKANGRKPFRLLPPPSDAELSELRALILQFVEHNLAYERKSGIRIDDENYVKVEERLDELFAILRRASGGVRDLGDWLIRVQHDLFRIMRGEAADQIVFLPMWELTELFRDDLAVIATSAAGSREQAAGADQDPVAPPQNRPGAGGPPSFWIYCPACLRRNHASWIPGKAVMHVCEVCHHRQELSQLDLWTWLMPDIVAYEAGVFRLGIGGWVAGSHAPYHPVIEQVYRQTFDVEMPPKFFLESVPTFHGMGDPTEGYGKTRLLRAWLEASPGSIAAGLQAPWREKPKLFSDVLPPFENRPKL